MKFYVKDFFSKCDQIRRKLQICLHLLKKYLMETSFFVQCEEAIDNSLTNTGNKAPKIYFLDTNIKATDYLSVFEKTKIDNINDR